MKKILDRSILANIIGTNTYTALRCLLENSYYAQETDQSFFCGNFDKKHYKGYLNEFCTVRMCTARQSGHSTAICYIALEYFDRAILLSAAHQMSINLNRCMSNLKNKSSYVNFKNESENKLTTTTGKEYIFGTYDNLDRFQDIKTEAVFVDGTFDITPKKEDEIYDVLAPCMKHYPQRFFIFVQ